MEHHQHIQDKVMSAIKRGDIGMRPKWHFIAETAGWAFVTIVVAILLINGIGLALFLLQDSGVLQMLVFGFRGWAALWAVFPLVTLVITLCAILVFQFLLRRYALVYRYSILMSLAFVVAVTTLSGLVIALTPLHEILRGELMRNHVPGTDMVYGPAKTSEFFRGEVIVTSPAMWIVESPDGMVKVFMTPETKIPFGADLDPGDEVLILGEEVSTGTIRAFGIREIDRNMQRRLFMQKQK